MNDDLFRIDIVDEASDESFPASDPPAFTGLHLGAPQHEEAHAAEPRDPVPWRRRVAFAQGALCLAGGLWLAGRKRKKWLGAALACVGLVLLQAARRY